MTPIKKIPLLVAVMAGLVISALSPSMSTAHEAQQKDIDSARAENEAIRNKVLSMEEEIGSVASALEGLKSAFETEMKRLRADVEASLEALAEEARRTQGRIEEAAHSDEELKKTAQSIEDGLASIGARLQALETAASVATTLGADVATIKKAVDDLSAKTNLLEGRVGSLEQASATESPPTPQPDANVKEDPLALYGEGYRLTMTRRFPEARGTLERFLSLYPQHERADNAQYWLAETYYAEGDYERAVLEFNNVLKKYPQGDKVPSALLKQAYSFEAIGATKEYEILIQRLMENHPASPEAEIARKKLKKAGQ